VFIQGISAGNPKSNTLYRYWPQHTVSLVCVITQQYSSVTFVLLLSDSHKKFSGTLLKKCYDFDIFPFLKKVRKIGIA